MRTKEENTGIHVYAAAGFVLTEDKKKCIEEMCSHEVQFPEETFFALPINPSFDCPDSLYYKLVLRSTFDTILRKWKSLSHEHAPWSIFLYNTEKNVLGVKPYNDALEWGEPFQYTVSCQNTALTIEGVLEFPRESMPTIMVDFVQRISEGFQNQKLQCLPYKEICMTWNNRNATSLIVEDVDTIGLSVEKSWIEVFGDVFAEAYQTVINIYST